MVPAAVAASLNPIGINQNEYRRESIVIEINIQIEIFGPLGPEPNTPWSPPTLSTLRRGQPRLQAHCDVVNPDCEHLKKWSPPTSITLQSGRSVGSRRGHRRRAHCDVVNPDFEHPAEWSIGGVASSFTR